MWERSKQNVSLLWKLSADNCKKAPVFSADDSLLVVVSANGIVRLWNAKTAARSSKAAIVFEQQHSKSNSVFFSSDIDHFAIASDDTVKF